MKKLISIIFVLCFTVATLNSANRFLVSFTGNYMTSSDSVYKNVYGSSEFYPEFKAGVRIFNNFYVWGGFGFLSANGHTYPDLNLDAEAGKNYLSAGVMYQGKGKTTYRIDVGLLYVDWEETALNQSNNGSSMGFRCGVAFIYNWSPTLFTEISSAYLIASDKIGDIDLKLGGFVAGAGIGLRF